MSVAARSSDKLCPHCGKATGSSLRCACCGRLVRHSRFRKRTLLAVGLLLCFGILVFVFNAREAPLVCVADIRPIRNFTTVQIQGVVQEDLRQLNQGGYYLLLNDGTGSLPLFITAKSMDQKLVAGDQVTAVGRLSITPELMASLRVCSFDQIQLRTPDFVMPAEATSIQCVTKESVGKTVTLCGLVGNVSQPAAQSRVPCKLCLRDSSGVITVIYWDEVAAQLCSDAPRTGDYLQVRGVVSLYRGELQLTVSDAMSVRKLEGVSAKPGASQRTL